MPSARINTSMLFPRLSTRLAGPPPVSTSRLKPHGYLNPAASLSPAVSRRCFASSPERMQGDVGARVNEWMKEVQKESDGAHNWASPGPAAFDFRSDVVTTPTTTMLAAIRKTTLLDDVFLEDPTTKLLEAHMASLASHDAGLLVLSGTMGNQVALRTHLAAPPHAILCDGRSHVVLWEAGGASSLSNAFIKAVVPQNGHYLTLEDVERHAELSEDVHMCPTRVISLENTLNGMVMPLDEARKISQWAREHGIVMHLDGARLWEAVSAGAGTLEEYCSLFDSVSLCFSKGLGAPIGSAVVGSQPFINRARWIRKMLGGGLRQAGVVSAPALVAVQETFAAGKLTATHGRAKRVQSMWEQLGGRVVHPVETNMVWLDVEAAGLTSDQFIEMAEEAGLRASGGRLVVHYQISDEALQRLEGLMKRILVEGRDGVRGSDSAVIPSEETKTKAML